MLTFGPDVQIKYFVSELLPMLVNASMWSNRSGIGVIVEYIDDDTNDPQNPYGVGLAMKLDADTGAAQDRHALYLYLHRVMPDGFYVQEFVDHVFMEWRLRGRIA